MDRKESAMCHVPPAPLPGLRSTTAAVKHRDLPRTNIYRHTDRKLFDIKLLVFRGKSQRNFLFYTRRKNYFHIRLTSFFRRAQSNRDQQLPAGGEAATCRRVSVSWSRLKTDRRVVCSRWRTAELLLTVSRFSRVCVC